MDSCKPLVEQNKRAKALLFLFILLFSGMRLWILIHGIFMSHEDELYNGTITREIIKGLKMPLFDYQSEPYAGGTLITGIMAVPFFILFGSSYFSLKLVAFTLSLGSLIICFILLNRHFSLRVACVASLLFIFSPPLFAEASLITMGNHCESIFFSLLTILIFFEIFFHKEEDPFDNKKRLYFLILLFGIVSGFSLYFAYIYISTLLTCFFFWFILDKRFFIKRYFLIFCLSFIAGFLPWIYYNFTHSFLGIEVITTERYLATTISNSFFPKLIRYISSDIPNILNLRKMPITGSFIANYFYPLTLIISLFFITWKSKDSFKTMIKSVIPSKRYEEFYRKISKESFFIMFFIFISSVYLFSRITISGNIEPYLLYRHLLPLFPIFFITLALFLSGLTESRNGVVKIFGYTLLLPILIFCSLSNFKIPSSNGVVTYFDLDGFSYKSLGWSVYRRFGIDFNKYLEQGEKIDPDYRHLYYYGLGQVISGRGLVWKKGFEQYEKFEEMIRNIDLIYQSYYYEGIGYKVGYNVIYNEYKMPISDMKRIPEKKRYYAYMGMARVLQEKESYRANIPEIINGIDKKYRKFFYPLLGKYILTKNGSFENAINFTKNLEHEEKEGVYRGFGFTLFNSSNFDIIKFKKIIEPFPKGSRVFLYEAAGETIGFLYRGKIKNLQEIFSPLPESDKASLYRGIGRFVAERYGFNLTKCLDFIKQIVPQYRQYCYKGIGAQIAFRFKEAPEIAASIIDRASANIKPIIQKGFTEGISENL